MSKKMLATVTLALLASSACAAEPRTFYAGLDAGVSKLDRTNSDGTAIGGILGYNISKHWAVEFAARDLGKFDVNSGDISATQMSLAAIGTITLGKGFDLSAHLGTNYVEVKNHSRFHTLDNGNFHGGNYGVGAAYHFTPAIAGRVEFQQAATDLSIVTAGVIFTF
jgi:OOP family OmpA-OmpF porin